MRTKQILSIFLIFIILLGVFSIPAFAEELDIPVTEEPEEPYLFTRGSVTLEC